MEPKYDSLLETAKGAIMGQPPDAHYPAWYAGMLKDVPAADVREDTHGLWIEGEYGFNRCSECGYEFDRPEEKTLFCPGCGANMEPR